MKKETIYRKVLVSERVPSKSGKYFTDLGYSDYSIPRHEWCDLDWCDLDVKWWLEEIQLPSEEDIKEESTYIGVEFEMGANYILGFINNKK